MAFADMQLRWKVILVAGLVFIPMMLVGTWVFFREIHQFQIQTALGGLMNFVDAKQQGTIRFLGQNEKFARQLSVLADTAPADTWRRYVKAVVETDVFRVEDHPFGSEVKTGKREIATFKVYHSIDLARDGRIVVSSDSAREGLPLGKPPELKAGYSNVRREGKDLALTFGAPTQDGAMVYVRADAGMLTLIANGEIGNLEGDMGAYYLAGVGKTFDYYLTDAENYLISESRVQKAGILTRRGSEEPWKRTTGGHKDADCQKDGTYITNVGLRTGCREAMGTYTGPLGHTMLGASMPFYDSNWTIVVEQESDELLEPLFAVLYKMLIMGAIMAVTTFVAFAFVITHFVFRPLAKR